jgi:SAM-dependent methyltransferase
MPDEAVWEELFDVPLVLDRLGVAGLSDVAELGCGHGTFTLPVARRVGGTVHACDVDDAMVTRTRERAAAAGLTNIVVECRDVLAEGFGLPSRSQDGCLLFNILHHEDPVAMLTAAAEVLRPGGRLFVIHWRYDAGTPRGPDLSIRPRPEDILAWAEAAGLRCPGDEVRDLPPWHFGLVLVPAEGR